MHSRNLGTSIITHLSTIISSPANQYNAICCLNVAPGGGNGMDNPPGE